MRPLRRVVFFGALTGFVAAGVLVNRAIQRRYMGIWLPAYVKQALRPDPPRPAGPIHLMVFFTDHFEPKFEWLGPTTTAQGPDRERERVRRWTSEYPVLADRHRDAYGRPPQHTFFYPYDEFEAWTLQALNRLVFAGYGEVDLHLHHSGDTEATLRAKLTDATRAFGEYGALLTFEERPQARYGFIHGNWALDNAEPEADECGVNTELDVLRETGCYADYTFPAFREAEQPRTINTIYYAEDTPAPKSYDTGIAARVGRQPPAKGLLLVEGVLGLNWRRRRFGIVPKTEISGNLFWQNPPTPARADYWVRANVHVEGRPEWTFIKIHCHGADESQMVNFFEGPVDRLFTYFETAYNDGANYVLHYVTAREAYNIIKAAEAGETGDPDQYRDYAIAPPPNTIIAASAPYALREGGERVRLRFVGAGPVTVQLRQTPLTTLTASVSALIAERDSARVELTDVEPLHVGVRRPIARVEGATVTEATTEAGEWTYTLLPDPEAERVQWHYGDTAP